MNNNEELNNEIENIEINNKEKNENTSKVNTSNTTSTDELQQKIKNRKSKMKKKLKPKQKLLIGLIILVLMIIIGYIGSEYIIWDKNERINLVINNNNITSNLKDDIYVENNIIYMSMADISNFFDKHIYYEEEIDRIITTYDKKLAEISYDEKQVKINGSYKDIYATATKMDNVTYLPISELNDVYNIEIEYIPETKVITMDSLDREQKQAISSSGYAIKSSTNLIAKTIDRVEKGETVVIISQTESHTKIRTQDGKIGYIKSNKLENEFIVREAMEDEKQIEGKINLSWEYFSEYASAPDKTGTEIEGVNVVSPSFFYVDDDGELKTNVGQSGEEYIEWAHNNGYKVWPMVSNAEAGMKVTSQIMNSYEKREELIEELVDVCVKYKLDGLNIDFENMYEADKDLYSRFIIELTPRLKEIGMVTSVDVTAPDGSPTWSLCYDRYVLGDIADYLVFMAYDQYGTSSTKPGTTAGYDWVSLSVEKFVTNEGVDPDKIILAVPFYTRLWTTNTSGEIVKNNTVSMKNINSVLPEAVERVWDDKTKQFYVEYPEGNNTKHMWVEDIDSLTEKVNIINEYELAGVASWVKGMEDPDVWDMFIEELDLEK